MARALFLLLFCTAAAAQDAASLRSRHDALRDALANNPFGRPMHVVSHAERGAQQGEVYAVLDEPYRAVASALARAESWCDILILQVNVKRCEAGDGALASFVTQKPRDTVEDAYRVAFAFSGEARPDYLHVSLTAPEGPLGTRDYAIRVEAVPLDGNRTFLHLFYTFRLGWLARFAMSAYLAGAGRNKAGFTVVERRPDGTPVYIDGIRGVVERNAMRYTLAVESYVETLSAPATERLDARLRHWYTQTTRYPQLKEVVGPDEYVAMKKREAG